MMRLVMKVRHINGSEDLFRKTKNQKSLPVNRYFLSREREHSFSKCNTHCIILRKEFYHLSLKKAETDEKKFLLHFSFMIYNERGSLNLLHRST